MSINSLRQARPKVTTIFGQPWRSTVTCPGCGSEAIENRFSRSMGTPRFSCPDGRCPFARGWLLRPTSEVTHNMRDGRPVHRIVAVPLDAAGAEDWGGQKPWPRSKTKTNGEDS